LWASVFIYSKCHAHGKWEFDNENYWIENSNFAKHHLFPTLPLFMSMFMFSRIFQKGLLPLGCGYISTHFKEPEIVQIIVK